MTDEQLVTEWLRMLNQKIPASSAFPEAKKKAGPIWWDVQLAGTQVITVNITKPITREHLVARVEQLIVGRVNDRFQSS